MLCMLYVMYMNSIAANGRTSARFVGMTDEVWAVIGVGVALLTAILLQWRHLSDRIDKQGERLCGRIDAQGRDLGGRIDALGRDLRSELGGRLDALAREIRALGERVAKLEFSRLLPPLAKDEDPQK